MADGYVIPHKAREWKRFGTILVVTPALTFFLSSVLAGIIPGCNCNEGSGCHGCGADSLLEFLIMGGLTLTFVALLFLLPLCLISASVITRKANPGRRRG
jgi:ABC-type phosphate transport system permease subunit